MKTPPWRQQAVEQFRLALALAPNSARERLNYGLALLRAGDMKNGMAELQRVQKQDPALPHTWFNLGIAYKKMGDFDKAAGAIRADGAAGAGRAGVALSARRAF